MKVRFASRARDDLDRLHAFLFPKDPNAADKVVDLLYDAAVSLRDAPERGRPLPGGIRELIVPFGKAAYIIRYHLDDAKRTVLITRIWHSRELR